MSQRIDSGPDTESARAPAGATTASVRWVLVALGLMVPALVAALVDAFGTLPGRLLVAALGCCGMSCAIVAVLGVVEARRRGKNPVVALARGVWAAIRWLFSMVP